MMKIDKIGGTHSTHDANEEIIQLFCWMASEREPGLHGRKTLSWIIQKMHAEFNGVELLPSVKTGIAPRFHKGRTLLVYQSDNKFLKENIVQCVGSCCSQLPY
jgi:hypothetical protein